MPSDPADVVSRTALALRGVALLVLIAATLLVADHIGLPTQAQLRHTVDRFGPWAPVGFAGLYAVVSLTPLPKTVFSLAAGVIFGIGVGLPAVLTGATLGALGAYGLARVLGRDAVHRLLGDRFDRLDRLLERRGFTSILVARLIPVIPFTTINYVAGLTRVRPRDFTGATALGILPATAAYVTLGAYGSRPGTWPFWAALGTLAVLTLAGAVAGWRRRRRHPGHRHP